jgi:hypothetical protein
MEITLGGKVWKLRTCLLWFNSRLHRTTGWRYNRLFLFFPVTLLNIVFQLVPTTLDSCLPPKTEPILILGLGSKKQPSLKRKSQAKKVSCTHNPYKLQQHPLP